MQIKHTSSGLTLLEIMFSLIIASLILLYLIPQQLKTSRDQMVSQTVAEMNQIVLAARNYYQDSYNASPATTPANLWPQSLSALSTYNYLPPAALCSPWPSSINDATCGYHVAYTIFPANASNAYDQNALGIAAASPNDGGNFWGVSITLPNATIAQAVEQRLPFATLCAPAQLKGGTSTSCTATSNTVTTIVPRPAQWSATSIKYSNDGLIQNIGAFKVCNDDSDPPPPAGDGEHTGNLSNYVQQCIYTSYSTVVSHYIPIPAGAINASTNPTNSCSLGTKPVVFVYPSMLQTYVSGDKNDNNNNTVAATSTGGYGTYYPGIALRTEIDTRNSGTNNQWILWMRTASDTKSTSIGPRKFHKLRADYFTTCSPNNDANKWDPSNFPGTNSNSSYQLDWTIR